MGSHPVESNPLAERLADVLPKDVSFTFYHISTPPTRCEALYSAPSGMKPERTYCESHSLAVSITPKNTETPEGLLVFAIEILIYTTKRLTTLFVSKADSTGFLSLLSLPRAQGSPLKAIATTFISFLVEKRQRPGTRLVVSLFARAQHQYLFPASIDNSTKHVLDDRGLIKWWCRVLDPILRNYAPEDKTIGDIESENEQEPQTTSKGYLTIPGVERHETLRFFPASSQNDPPPPQKRWVHGHPLRQLSRTPAAPPRSLIPRFPDDPKSRYMDELDDEVPELASQPTSTPTRGTGNWRSIKSLEQFWEMMAFRQECSSGRLVGFIWVVFTPPDLSPDDERTETKDSQATLDSTVEPSARPSRQKRDQKKARRKRKVLSGPISVRLPRIKSVSSSHPAISQPDETPYYLWPPSSRGGLVVTEKDYQRAHELLLHQNFGTRTAAAASSRRWVAEIGVLAGTKSNWGWTVTGRKETAATAGPAGPTGPVGPPSSSGISGSSNGSSNGSVNVLNITAVRKKRKVDEDTKRGETTAGEATMLGAGLVRKKAKADEATGGLETVARQDVG